MITKGNKIFEGNIILEGKSALFKYACLLYECMQHSNFNMHLLFHINCCQYLYLLFNFDAFSYCDLDNRVCRSELLNS